MAVDIAYEAYQNFVKKVGADPKLPLLPYNPNQLFWIQFGQQFCSENGDDFNGIPLEYSQLSAVKNSRYFGRDFNCSFDREMNPKTKCIII